MPVTKTKNLVRQSEHIAILIKDLATEYNVPTSCIDFSLHNTITEVKLPNSEQYEELTTSNISTISNRSLLIDPDFFVRQIHQVTFRVLKEPPSLLQVQISSDKHRTKAYATVLPESTIKDTPNLREIITNELNKIKIRYQMLINIKEGSYRSDIGALVNKIRVHNGLNEPFRVQLCEWISPIETINDELILHYKNKKAPTENDRIDYADRGFINAVEEGNLLVEYIKPKMGTAGRDFRGKHIPIKEPKTRFSPVMSVDENSVDTVMGDSSICYYALKKGYASYKGDRLAVGDVLEIESVNFKETGDIKSGIDKDIKISVKTKNLIDDSIGPNSQVEASEIDIEGNVANGAKVTAQRVSIKGQTHSTSKISANEANIGILRGTLECEYATINQVEHGIINAKEITIGGIIGGFVAARIIKINSIYSHATIVASSRVEIGSIEGGENKIFIEAAAYKEDKRRLKELLVERNKLSVIKNETLRKHKNKRDLVIRNKYQAEKIKEKIDSEKKAGRMVASVFIERYKEYLEAMQEVKELNGKLTQQNEEISLIEEEINAIQNTVFNAVVINHSNYTGYNEIKFRLVNPLKEISFVPNEKDLMQEIKLEQIGLDDYTIKVFG